ncbi:MAG TPA: universal stress protein [Candidatus Limnocylindrales bacterium]
MRALLAIDGSGESENALDTAASLVWPPRSRLDIVTVVPADTELLGGPWMFASYDVVPAVRDRLRDEGRRLVDEAAALVRRPGLEVVGRVLEGRAATAITDAAKRTGAQLVIVGARGHGTLERMLLGSVSAEVVDHADCPVLVARQGTAWRILVATDGSPDAELGVGLVAESGVFRYATARVVNVVDVPSAWWLGIGDTAATVEAYSSLAGEARAHGRRVTDDAVARLRAAGIEADGVVSEGSAPTEIVAQAAAWGADLIVVGTRGHGLLMRLIVGSTARTIVQHAPSSVLVARPTAVAPDPRRGHAVRVVAPRASAMPDSTPVPA